MTDRPASEIFAERIRAARGDRSMAEMGTLVGVSRQTWRDWELGVTFPLADKLDLIAAALDLDSVAELFEEGNGAA